MILMILSVLVEVALRVLFTWALRAMGWG